MIGVAALQEHGSCVTASIQVKGKEAKHKRKWMPYSVWLCSYKTFPESTVLNADRYVEYCDNSVEKNIYLCHDLDELLLAVYLQTTGLSPFMLS